MAMGSDGKEPQPGLGADGSAWRAARVCEWCGRMLEVRMIEVNGRSYAAGYEPCGCAGEAAVAAEARRAEAETEARLIELKVAASGVGKRFLRARVSDEGCARYLAEFGERPGCGLYLHGGVGTGKTHNASAMARCFVEAGYRVVLTTTIGMLEAIRETFDSGGSALQVCRSFGRCDVLLLDDLGKEGASAWSVMMLFEVINMRYEAELPTVVTSQYAPGSIARRLGRGGEADTASAIASRVLGSSDVVRLLGPDHRLT